MQYAGTSNMHYMYSITACQVIYREPAESVYIHMLSRSIKVCMHTLIAYCMSSLVYLSQVTYDAKQADPHHAKMGKLVVTSQHSVRSAGTSRRQTPPPISWVYYLKGLVSS